MHTLRYLAIYRLKNSVLIVIAIDILTEQSDLFDPIITQVLYLVNDRSY